MQLAAEIREFLVREVSKTGGHLGPNLGVVELTIAMHRVFDSPRDAIVFDTGHQSYVHKLLTGRSDFSRLRQEGGMAGYPQRSESVHDIVESSHASSSLSWADGISKAFAMTGQPERHVVAVVGDGALTGGMTWEALNNISDDNSRNLVIVVNDNGRSYAPTIGGISRFLANVRTRRTYRRLHLSSRKFFYRLGTPARSFYRGVRGGLHGFMSRFWNNEALYSNLDIKYIGPVNGHDLRAMEEALRQARNYGAPVIVHAITEKGRGYEPALMDVADQFHAVGQIDPETGEPIEAASKPSWTAVFGDELVELAERDARIVGVTAAMLRPTGLHKMAERFPDRVTDVGIAEQHAVTSAAGLAFGGLHPVVAIYATFINRAFDQVLMDVALHRAGVTFVLDRAGVTGPDGPSHHGIWDLAILQVVPHIRIARSARRRAAARGAGRGGRGRRRADRHPVPAGIGRQRVRCRPAHRRRRGRAARGRAQGRAHRDRRADGEDRAAGCRAAGGPGDRRHGDRPALGRAGARRASSRWRLSTGCWSRSRTACGSAVSARASGRTSVPPGSTPRSPSWAFRTSSSSTAAGSTSSSRPGLTPQAIARDVVAQVLGSKIPVARPLPAEAPDGEYEPTPSASASAPIL